MSCNDMRSPKSSSRSSICEIFMEECLTLVFEGKVNQNEACLPALRTRGKRHDGLQIAAAFLFNPKRLEQGLKVAFAKRLASSATNDLKKQRRSILQRLGEYLQQISLVVTVGYQPQVFD